MTSSLGHLLDTSALVRLIRDPDLGARWTELINAGLLAVSPITELEFLFSARSKAHREELVRLLSASFSLAAIPDRAYARAAEVQVLLTDHGWHRPASAVDLIVAATAEINRHVLVHYDRDFERIETVTGQPMVWIASPGSIA